MRQNKPLSADIFETLKDRIVSLEYPPGMQLVEKDLCDEFAVSRSPVREAFRKLQEINLVTAIPRYGTLVSEIDINEFRHALEVMINLQGLASSRAAQLITPEELKNLEKILNLMRGIKNKNDLSYNKIIKLEVEFHSVVYQAAKNPILLQHLESLHARCARLWQLALKGQVNLGDIIEQFEGIQLALVDGNPQRAAELSARHTEYFIDKVRKQFF